jgi:hypothetical protein
MALQVCHHQQQNVQTFLSAVAASHEWLVAVNILGEVNRPRWQFGKSCPSSHTEEHNDGIANWYNGHPEFDWVWKIIDDVLVTTTSIQSIGGIGHGNIRWDCAHICAKTQEQLEHTDVTTSALEILNPSSRPLDTKTFLLKAPNSFKMIVNAF